MLEITTKKRPLPPRIFIYGPPKIGKTTLASQLPNALLIPVEDGADAIDVAKTQQPKTWAELITILDEIVIGKLPYLSLAIDSVTVVEALAGREVAQKNKAASVEEIPYGKGYPEVCAMMRIFLEKLNEIRLNKNMAILLIGHLATIKYEDPRSQGYDRFQPRINKAVLPLFVEWSDALICANYKVYASETGGKVKATGDGERVFFCTEKPTHLAGNRYGIGDEVPMAWGGIFSAIAARFSTQKEQPQPEKSGETAAQSAAESKAK